MREQAPTDLLYPRLHPEWNQYFIPFQFPRKYPQRRFRALYVHKFKNVVSRAFPLAPSKQSTCGGFLCDEMGKFVKLLFSFLFFFFFRLF